MTASLLTRRVRLTALLVTLTAAPALFVTVASTQKLHFYPDDPIATSRSPRASKTRSRTKSVRSTR